MRPNNSDVVGGVVVHGALPGGQTRCAHYSGPLDVIAIRFACCSEWYPCHLCHEETAGHPPRTWTADQQDAEAILCGMCGGQLSILDYRGTDSCPLCAADFNPGCRLHHHLYFD